MRKRRRMSTASGRDMLKPRVLDLASGAVLPCSPPRAPAAVAAEANFHDVRCTSTKSALLTSSTDGAAEVSRRRLPMHVERGRGCRHVGHLRRAPATFKHPSKQDTRLARETQNGRAITCQATVLQPCKLEEPRCKGYTATTQKVTLGPRPPTEVLDNHEGH